MIKIVDDLKGESLLLFEASLVFDLEPEDLSSRVGVSVDRIYELLGGGEAPTDDERGKMRAAVEKLKGEFSELMAGEAVWRAPKLTPEAIAADEDALDAEDAHIARVAEAGAALKAAVVGSEAECLEAAWPGFVEVARAMHERKIQFRI